MDGGGVVVGVVLGNKKISPHFGDFLYFFLDVLDGDFLYSLYSAIIHAYPNNADNAVMIPLISPSENIANSIIANTNTTVYPRFFAKTDKIFSIVFICVPFVVLIYYITFLFVITAEKNAAIAAFFWMFFYKIT